MKLKILTAVILVLLVAGTATAVELRPQGDINLQDWYNIINAGNVTIDGDFLNITTGDFDCVACINPEDVNDIDREDIEGDANTFVDIAGDNMTADSIFNWTGSNMTDIGYIEADDWTDVNITKSQVSDYDTEIGNCSIDQSCSAIIYDTDEGNLNVNGSDHWDNFGSANASQFEDDEGALHIIASWLTAFIDAWLGTKDTDDLTEGSTNLYDNQSWNETGASALLQEDIGSDCSAGDFAKGVDDDGTLDCSAPTAADVDAGTFPSGNYVFQDNVTAENIKLEGNTSHRIYANETCVFIAAATATLEVC